MSKKMYVDVAYTGRVGKIFNLPPRIEIFETAEEAVKHCLQDYRKHPKKYVFDGGRCIADKIYLNHYTDDDYVDNRGDDYFVDGWEAFIGEEGLDYGIQWCDLDNADDFKFDDLSWDDDCNIEAKITVIERNYYAVETLKITSQGMKKPAYIEHLKRFSTKKERDNFVESYHEEEPYDPPHDLREWSVKKITAHEAKKRSFVDKEYVLALPLKRKEKDFID